MDPSPPPSVAHAGLPIHRRWTVLAATALVFVAIWGFRWLAIDFANDHFVHLSRARQMLLGELPGRDFFDPGLPLHYVASSMAMMVFGQTLLGETLLTVTCVALGAALTFYLAARLSGSIAIAATATLAAAATFPRLYNYPKILLYPLALLVMWQYATGRARVWLAALACVTSVALLFRLDHGVYLGIAAVTAIALAHGLRPRALATSLAGYAIISAALLLPYVIAVQLTTGVSTYFRDAIAQSGTVAAARFLLMPIAVDTSQPWFSVSPRVQPRVSIRWQDGLDADTRVALERQYGLTDAAPDGSYVLTDDRSENIAALVADPSIADTHNIDRDTMRPVLGESWLQRARNRIPLLRASIAPGVLTPENALAWLYYTTVLVPVVAIIAMLGAWRCGTLNPTERAAIGAAAVMCLVIDQGLIRGSPDSRLPDVAGPTMVLAAWITVRVVRWPARRTGDGSRTPARHRAWTVAASMIAAIMWTGTLWSAVTLGETGDRIVASSLPAGPAATVDRIREVTRIVAGRPIDWYAPAGSPGVRSLTRYVLACTRATDRVLAGSFEPQLFFYAERAFAGGQVYLRGGWHSSREDQLLTIARMRRQRVPIAVLSAPTEAAIQRDFPLVYEYVRTHYREAARSTFGGERQYAVLARRDLAPRSIYEPLGLPCYR